MNYASNILETIGKTPMVKLNRITTDIPSIVLAKIESFNPGNSIKDRIAVKMIEESQKNYEKLIDEAADEISSFVEKASLKNLS